MVRIAIHGTGRMAGAIVNAAKELDDVEVIGLAGPQAPQQDSETAWVSSLDKLPSKPDFLIDFTLPEGTRVAAQWCAENGVPMVSGVTGLPDDVVDSVRAAAD